LVADCFHSSPPTTYECIARCDMGQVSGPYFFSRQLCCKNLALIFTFVVGCHYLRKILLKEFITEDLRLILEQEKRIHTSKMTPHCKKWAFYHSLNTKNSSFESLNNVANVITLQYINIRGCPKRGQNSTSYYFVSAQNAPSRTRKRTLSAHFGLASLHYSYLT